MRIPNAILGEPWDDSTLADMVRLQAFLNVRWARDRLPAREAGRAFLGAQDMMLITRTTNVTRAKRRLLALPIRNAGVTLAVAEASHGRYQGVTIDWPKFPKEQGYFDREHPQSRGNLGAISGPPHPHPHPQTHKKKESRVSRAPHSLPDGAYRCSEILIECLESVPGARIPKRARATWAAEIAKIPGEVPELRANGAEPWEHIEAAIRWGLGPENVGQKYEVVVRSGRSLREKWSKLVAAARRCREWNNPFEELERWIASES